VIIVSSPKSSLSPLSLILDAFDNGLGSLGRYGVIISSILFAFATLLTQYFYGIESLNFITKSKRLGFLSHHLNY
jgi:Na+/alanine symporter